MRNVARIIGMIWMCLVVAVTVWQGIREAFFFSPGLIFKEGYGEVFLAFALALPGYLLWTWGSRAKGKSDA